MSAAEAAIDVPACAATSPAEHELSLERLGETLCGLRLRDEQALQGMRQSLLRHGQLTAVAVFPRAPGELEVVDGFKRLAAARDLCWPSLRVRRLALDTVHAKAAMGVLNAGRGLCDLEQAWLVRSLYRDDGLRQPAIGRLLGRHKSWVCRRLALAESLDEAVQADVRLGLLTASAACLLARLPRCNQPAAAEVVVRRGLTVGQAGRLVTEAIGRPEGEPRERFLREELGRSVPAPQPRASSSRARSPAEHLLLDIGRLVRLSARLQARLHERPLAALGQEAAALVEQALVELVPILTALGRTAERVARREVLHVAVE